MWVPQSRPVQHPHGPPLPHALFSPRIYFTPETFSWCISQQATEIPDLGRTNSAGSQSDNVGFTTACLGDLEQVN